MPRKRSRRKSKPEEQVVHPPHTVDSNSTTVIPPAPSSSKLIQERISKKRYKNIVFVQWGLIAAIASLLIAYWQGYIQSSQSSFEKNQRVVEMSLSLGTFWEAQFDPYTRYRMTRFIAKLKSLKDSPDKQKALSMSLLDEKNMLYPDSINNDEVLSDLIKPDLGSDNVSEPGANPFLEVSKYRSALIKVMNTMEVIAVAKQHTKDLPEAQKVIESAYIGAIKQRYIELKPFIEAYQEKYNEGRKIPAWGPLDDVVNEK